MSSLDRFTIFACVILSIGFHNVHHMQLQLLVLSIWYHLCMKNVLDSSSSAVTRDNVNGLCAKELNSNQPRLIYS
jgi:hypothetical protein